MANSILGKDSDLTFPQFTVLTASAGSGKTYALAQRFVQFILSERIPFNSLHNILAITFSNNAAKEMKDRIMIWLKKACLGDPVTIAELKNLLSLDEGKFTKKAGDVIEEILAYYEDFQVKTIDSFMASIFKASAIDFGYNPDFDIIVNSGPLIEYAFDLYLRRVREDSPECKTVRMIIDIIEENRAGDEPFLWNPRDNVLAETRQIHRELMATGKPILRDNAAELETLKALIVKRLSGLEAEISRSGLARSRASAYPSILYAVKSGRFGDLAGKSCKATPVNKPKGQQDAVLYGSICHLWEDFGRLVKKFSRVYARTYYLPYVQIYEEIQEALERLKRQEAAVFLEDMNRRLSHYLTKDLIPDVYLRLGDTIYHYLIDEFQDTSPVQWSNLLPLTENALSQGGSLFVVGDTKQAIYGFRNADYAIMKGLEEENPFPSATAEIRELDVNYRSFGEIVRFTEGVFGEAIAGCDIYSEAAGTSGLLGCKQWVKKGNEDKGYVECTLYEGAEEEHPEQVKLRQLVATLKERGYGYQDLTILAMRNDDVIRIASWLNDDGIPFISYSSLDVRNRKITGEILALLRFLDSPLDDLSFGTFLLGEIFRRALEIQGKEQHLDGLQRIFHKNSRQEGRPLYKAFQDEALALWDHYFDNLFKLSGYLPLYDLVVAVYGTFDVWRAFKDDDEATLVKILETIKEFESDGRNSMRDFLESADSEEDGDSDWNVQAPQDVDAVRIMTVHKAKGLGFPVVIVLLYGERNRGFKFVVEDAEGGVRLLRLNRDIASSATDLASLYRDKERRFLIDRLNSLYVAFTRARSELYIVGVRKKERYPFDLLLPYVNSSFGTPPEAVREGLSSTACTQTLYNCPLSAPGSFAVENAPLRGLSIEEKERGEIIHRAFSVIDFVDGDTEIRIEAALRRWGGETAFGLRRTVLTALSSDDLRDYFLYRPGRIVKREQEYIDKRGVLVRMDRVVIDQDTVTVIDFKTGGGSGQDGSDRAQIRNYLRIIEEAYSGRKSQGLIAYLDQGRVEKVTLAAGQVH